jgi:hypothetical protein
LVLFFGSFFSFWHHSLTLFASLLASGRFTVVAGSREGGYQDGMGSPSELPSINTTLTASVNTPENQVGEAKFKSPYAVEVDEWGNLYVADTGNCTIRRIARNGIRFVFALAISLFSCLLCSSTPSGMVTTIVGNPKIKQQIDGQGSEACLSNPMALFFDSKSHLLIIDETCIRKLTAFS